MAFRQSISIRSLKPNVTREDALRHFSGTFPWANWFHGPVQSIADLYIPFRLFAVKVVNRGREESHIFGVDAAQGVLDPYEFQTPPAPADLISLDTRNVLPASLDPREAKALLLAKIQRLVFARGFFRLRDARFDAVEIPGQICVPYWVCFRGVEVQLRVSVLDAVRRRPEGAKVRRLIEEWLRSNSC
ncbi:MAG: hypothetical protein ACM3JD_14505 [Rudaea sp.]